MAEVTLLHQDNTENHQAAARSGRGGRAASRDRSANHGASWDAVEANTGARSSNDNLDRNASGRLSGRSRTTTSERPLSTENLERNSTSRLSGRSRTATSERAVAGQEVARQQRQPLQERAPDNHNAGDATAQPLSEPRKSEGARPKEGTGLDRGKKSSRSQETPQLTVTHLTISFLQTKVRNSSSIIYSHLILKVV